MKYQLWQEGAPGFREEFGQEQPSLEFYPSGEGTHGCVIICPGGAYVCLAPHEGEPVARMLNERGFSAFVLTYRLSPYRYPIITGDVLRAVRYVRFNAKRFGIDPDHIGVLGFSAGGHLAMSSSRLFDYGLKDGDEIDAVSSRPDACVLCYAVSTLRRPITNEGTRINLIGGLENEEELAGMLSGDENVRPDTPPTFIWHTADDEGVRSEQALTTAAALHAAGVHYELHIFPHGPHGLGLAEGCPDVGKWSELLETWLRQGGWR